MDNLVPSTPNVATVTQVAAALRTLLAYAGGLGLGGGMAVSDSTVSTLLTLFGVAAPLISLAWSRLQKQAAARKTHQTAVASAAAGVAVQPAVPTAA